LLVLETEEDTALTRSAEVQKLATSITDLAVLFKDLSALVVE
jgi:t-SNARE complex subunit (syntaxin)